MSDSISRQQLLSRLNSTGINIIYDIPVEEVLGENIDLDDFATLVQDAIQVYRRMVIGTIEKMPTDHNIDKIVEQLENMKSIYQRLRGLKDKDYLKYGYKIETLIDAIEIVKGGDL